MATLATLTVTMSNPYGDMADPNKIVLDWKSTDLGVVSIAICSTFATAQGAMKVSPKKLRGFIRAIETIPGLLGDLTTTLPTTLYDITILDAYGLDVTAGVLADRSAAVAETEVPISPLYVDSELTLTIANAGNAKTGRIIIEMASDATVR